MSEGGQKLVNRVDLRLVTLSSAKARVGNQYGEIRTGLHRKKRISEEALENSEGVH